MFDLILDKQIIQQFKIQRKTRQSELKENLNQAIEKAKKQGVKEFIIKFNKPTYYSVIKRHLNGVKWSAKYNGYKIVSISIQL